MVYITRRLVKRCRSAGPAFNTRGVFRRPLISPDDAERIVIEQRDYSEPIRNAVAEQIARIRRSTGPEKEQHIVALLIYLTLNLAHIRTNKVQLNAYRVIARHYSEVGLVAWAAATDFLEASE